MGYIEGEGRSQGTLFPVVLDDFVPPDHMCRVIDAFVERLTMSELGFERAEAAATGRPGYNPRDLLKLYRERNPVKRSTFSDTYPMDSRIARSMSGRLLRSRFTKPSRIASGSF